jgi:hypothetical protein
MNRFENWLDKHFWETKYENYLLTFFGIAFAIMYIALFIMIIYGMACWIAIFNLFT